MAALTDCVMVSAAVEGVSSESDGLAGDNFFAPLLIPYQCTDATLRSREARHEKH